MQHRVCATTSGRLLAKTSLREAATRMNSKVYIETFGCQMNVADTERAVTGLRKAGYEMTSATDEADVVLLNTCSVRERAERKVFRRVSELRKSPRRPVIGVMGCVAQLEGPSIFQKASAVDLVVGTRATDRIPSLLARLSAGEKSVIDLEERQEGEVWDVSPAERRSRMRRMREHVREHNIYGWAGLLVAELAKIPQPSLQRG